MRRCKVCEMSGESPVATARCGGERRGNGAEGALRRRPGNGRADWAGLAEKVSAARPTDLLVFAGVDGLNRNRLVHINDFRLFWCTGCSKRHGAQCQESFRALRHPRLLYSWKVASEHPIPHPSSEAKAAWVRPAPSVADCRRVGHGTAAKFDTCDSATSGWRCMRRGTTISCGIISKSPRCSCHPDRKRLRKTGSPRGRFRQTAAPDRPAR